jgi:hypothetical protein
MIGFLCSVVVAAAASQAFPPQKAVDLSVQDRCDLVWAVLNVPIGSHNPTPYLRTYCLQQRLEAAGGKPSVRSRWRAQWKPGSAVAPILSGSEQCASWMGKVWNYSSLEGETSERPREVINVSVKPLGKDIFEFVMDILPIEAPPANVHVMSACGSIPGCVRRSPDKKGWIASTGLPCDTPGTTRGDSR